MDITALAASPVSESQPAGADAKYEPEYEALTAEIGKLSSVSQSSPVSWQAVAGNGAVILAQKSKDISVRRIYGRRADTHGRRAGLSRRREPAARDMRKFLGRRIPAEGRRCAAASTHTNGGTSARSNSSEKRDSSLSPPALSAEMTGGGGRTRQPHRRADGGRASRCAT